MAGPYCNLKTVAIYRFQNDKFDMIYLFCKVFLCQLEFLPLMNKKAADLLWTLQAYSHTCFWPCFGVLYSP